MELTGREEEIYKLLILGLSKDEIKEKLYIENSTLKTHMQRIFKKKQVHSYSDLLRQRIKSLNQWINKRYVHNR